MLKSCVLKRSYSFLGNRSLKDVDIDVYNLSVKETKRQVECLELVASENFASRACLLAMATNFNNKYSEGYPGNRYYGGTSVVDELELLTQKRALETFHLDNKIWGVNVQALSGSSANVSVYTGLLKPGGKLMGLLLSDGGHLTHGFRTDKKAVSASSLFWKSQSYTVHPENSLIDYDKLKKDAMKFKPDLIIAGASAYPRDIDFKKMREVADSTNSILMADIAHTAGTIAARLSPSPFEYCDVVTTTTHKTLRGVRGSLIFYRLKGDFKKKIDQAVFPGLQGGPHMHQIAGIAVALKEANTPEFVEYQKQVLKNMKAMADELRKNNVQLVTGGTDNHLALLDLRKNGFDGRHLEYVLDLMNITANKNSIPGSGAKPLGLRVGSPALTTRGFNEEDFRRVARLVVDGMNISKRLKKGVNKINDFKIRAENDEQIKNKKKEVTEFASRFPLPNYNY